MSELDSLILQYEREYRSYRRKVMILSILVVAVVFLIEHFTSSLIALFVAGPAMIFLWYWMSKARSASGKVRTMCTIKGCFWD